MIPKQIAWLVPEFWLSGEGSQKLLLNLNMKPKWVLDWDGQSSAAGDGKVGSAHLTSSGDESKDEEEETRVIQSSASFRPRFPDQRGWNGASRRIQSFKMKAGITCVIRFRVSKRAEAFLSYLHHCVHAAGTFVDLEKSELTF